MLIGLRYFVMLLHLHATDGFFAAVSRGNRCPLTLHRKDRHRGGLARTAIAVAVAVIALGLAVVAGGARLHIASAPGADAETKADHRGLRTDVLRFRRRYAPAGTRSAHSDCLRGSHELQRGLVSALPTSSCPSTSRCWRDGGDPAVVYAATMLPRATWIGSFERWIALLIWVAVALYLTGLLSDVIATLESMRLAIGKSQINVWDLLVAAASVLATVLAALWARRRKRG
jgi:hypothetical protein